MELKHVTGYLIYYLCKCPEKPPIHINSFSIIIIIIQTELQ